MFNPLRRFLQVLAASTNAELRRQIQYLKAENEVLRRHLPQRVRPTTAERRRLIRLGRCVGPALKSLISIVAYRTFNKWVIREKRRRGGHPRKSWSRHRPGRPRTSVEVRNLVLRIARETGYGYTRILGELKKLGVGDITRSTVVNILKEKGLPTGPARGESTWTDFLKRHGQTLWACDFLARRILTARGIRTAFVLVFVHPKTRRAHVSASTLRPDAVWFGEAVGELMRSLPTGTPRPTLMLRDRDSKYGAGFDDALTAASITAVQLPFRSPNLNAHAERMIQSIQAECLDHFVVLGLRHLDYLLAEYVDYFVRHRPHSALQFGTPSGPAPPARSEPVRSGEIRCQRRLGGVLKHYYRKVA